jgi:2-dehydro-3-deoxyglucarate aldolase/4-hydroxy-2-oxoheptanedioate aldolase
MNMLREKIRNRQLLFGTHVSLTDPCICEMVGYLGFDYIWIDMEHTYIDCKTLLSHLNATRAAGTSAIVRIPVDDSATLKKVLEMGPEGIVFPMIRSVRQAQALLDATFYPPKGTRGFGPARAIRYGLDDTDDYIHNGSKDLCRFIQIEHADAVACLDALIQIDEIDGFIFGPCDLSGSLGQLNHVFEADTRGPMDTAVRKLKKAGKLAGISFGPYDEVNIRNWYNLGMDMISVGNDMNYIFSGAKQALANLRSVYLDKTPIIPQ